MLSIFGRLLVLLLIASPLAACVGMGGSNGNSIVSQVTRSNGYVFIREAARVGEMRTAIYGNPYGEDATAVRERTIAAMQGHYRGGAFVFTENPTVPDADVHVVVALQPPAVLHVPNLCAAPADIATESASGETVRMAAAICLNSKLVASVRLQGANPGGTDTPAYAEQIGELTWTLMNLPFTENDRDCEQCD